jgi:hypothetical protein
VNLIENEKKFNEFREQEINKIERDKLIYKENMRTIEMLKCKDSDIFDLNIGGTHKISTLKNTLTKVNINK